MHRSLPVSLSFMLSCCTVNALGPVHVRPDAAVCAIGSSAALLCCIHLNWRHSRPKIATCAGSVNANKQCLAPFRKSEVGTYEAGASVANVSVLRSGGVRDTLAEPDPRGISRPHPVWMSLFGHILLCLRARIIHVCVCAHTFSSQIHAEPQPRLEHARF